MRRSRRQYREPIREAAQCEYCGRYVEMFENCPGCGAQARPEKIGRARLREVARMAYEYVEYREM